MHTINDNEMIRVFLCGYMGSGKTTLGKALAKEMSLTFIDLDAFIEARQHKRVKEIFADIKEEGFRALERKAILADYDSETVIIALGGGTPCFFDNMEIINKAGISIYLKPTEERLLQRLIIGKHKRPLLQNKSDDEILSVIREQLLWREPYYSKAKLTFDSTELENSKEISSTTKKLAEMIVNY